ncbi:MAG: tetratricopeptide repeat protein [Coriobacteriia bacterium]
MHAGVLTTPGDRTTSFLDPEANMTPDDFDVNDSDPAARVRALMQRGIAEANAGERIAAVASLKEAEQVAADAGLTSAAIGAHINRGWVLWFAGEAEGAITLYSEGAQMAREAGDAERLLLALNNLGIAYGRLGRHAESLATYEEYLPFVSDDPAAGAEAHLNCGTALASLGRPDEAALHFERAERLATDAGLAESLVMVNLNRGVLSESAGDLEAAFEHYWKAFDLADETKDADLIGTVTMALGAAYARAGDDPHASDCFEQSELAFRASGDRRRLADALHGHAIALQRVGLDDAALEALQEEEPLRAEQGDSLALGACILSQALLLAGRPKSPSTDTRFAEAAAAYVHAGALSTVAEVHHARAEWLRKQGMDDEALAAAREALSTAIKAPNLPTEIRVRGLLAVMLADAGDLEAAETELVAAEASAEESGDREGVTGAQARKAYVLARGEKPAEDVVAQLDAAWEHGLTLTQPQTAREALTLVVQEIKDRCDGRYSTPIALWQADFLVT